MVDEGARVQTEAKPRPEMNLEYVLYVFIGLGLCAVALFVFLYGQRGETVLRDLSKREPNAVMKEGIRQEWAGDLGAAAASYRQALALGFGDYWAEFGCKERLTRVLIQKGQLPELKLEDAVRLDAANLIVNGGFEDGDGTGGWLNGSDNATGLQTDNSEIIEGKRSLRIDLGKRGNPALRNDIALLPGYPYCLSGWLRTVGAEPNGVYLGVCVPGAENGPFHPRSDLFLGTRDWQQLLVRFTPPEGVTRVGLVLEVSADERAGETGSVWLDQCAIVRDQDNLLKNGSFESGDDGRGFWLGEPQPGVQFAADSEVVVEGARALRIEYPAQTGQAIRQEIPVEEKATYHMEAWFRTQALAGKGVHLVVKDVPTNGKALSLTGTFVNGTTEWTKSSLDVTVPEGIYSLTIAINHPASEQESGGTVWIDACAFLRQSAAP